MTTINTKLIKDGNSKAVRLPKTALDMSGLGQNVQMEVRQGQIILRPSRAARAGWKQQIAKVKKSNPTASQPDPELEDWDSTSNDGL